jgi:drug/metabolite transporter (DMT)-like permease
MKHTTAAFVMLLLTLIWGSTFPLIHISLQSLPPLYFLGLRFALGGALLLSLAFLTLQWRLRSVRSGIVCGILIFLGFALQTWGLARTTAARAAFITGLCVVLVPVFEHVFFKVQLGFRIWVGVFVSLAGLAALAFSAPQGASMTSDFFTTHVILGDFAVFLCAIAFAWHILAMAHYGKSENALALAAWQVVFVVPLAFLCSLFWEVKPWQMPNEKVWASLLFLAWIATALVTVTQIRTQRYLSATQAALIISLEPVFAAGFAWWWQGEKMGALAQMGSAAMLVGCVLASLPAQGQRLQEQVP